MNKILKKIILEEVKKGNQPKTKLNEGIFTNEIEKFFNSKIKEITSILQKQKKNTISNLRMGAFYNAIVNVTGKSIEYIQPVQVIYEIKETGLQYNDKIELIGTVEKVNFEKVSKQ